MALPAAEGPRAVQRFKRFGLGFKYLPPEAPVVMTFTSCSEKRGEVRAEVHVEALRGGHILRRYLNLLGSTSVRQLVGELAQSDGGAAFPWAAILESATESIILALRTGGAIETYEGELIRPPGVQWLCRGLVMAGVPNGWTAAGSTGKSTFAAGLLGSHALGERFLDRDVLKGTGLLLDWESTADDFEEKLWLYMRWLGVRSIPKVHRLQLRGPATAHAAAIANRIDGLGATLVVWDGMQAASGPLGQSGSYEALAQDMEALVGILPPTTHLFLDHVTGDELKSNAVPLKARGATRKIEWLRNHWTLSLDREAQQGKRHVVGWTHTKINRLAYETPFGVEVLHQPDELGFRLVAEQDVEPLRERMPMWRLLVNIGLEALPRSLSNKEAAFALLGRDDDKATGAVRSIVSRDHGRNFDRHSDGTFTPSRRWRANVETTAPQGSTSKVRHLRPVGSDMGEDDPDALPF